jgi:type IV pilus assembly protein PilQ
LATEDFGTSFSFGIGDTFFSTDGGAASFNYGGVNPPSRTDINGSRLSPPITGAPFPPGVDEVEPFLDAQPDAPFGTGDPQPFGQPPLNDGTIRIPGAIFARPPFGTDSNPLQGGVTDVQGGQIEFGLPELFQYPSRFLASLQAQVVSGNAKILTDPTLVIQEGQTANVDLTQDVVTNVQVQFTDSPGGTREDRTFEISPAGLQLEILVDRIDDNGFVTISVNPTVTSPIQTFSSEDGDELTLLSRREVNSGLLRLRDAQTLILSGIISETDRTEVSKIPILGDIPILGALFRSTSRENTRQEVIVLLTPQILDDSDISSFGYSYTPSRNAQELLQRQGVQVP